MASSKKSLRVPNAMRSKVDEIFAIIDPICDQYLDDEYKEYAHFLTAALARKRPSPLARGRANSWAAGIVHAIGVANFLTDPDFDPYLSSADLYQLFGVSSATGQSKSKTIRDLFDIYQFAPDWTVPSLLVTNPYVWMVELDGFALDARELSLEFQEMLVEAGVIPFTVERVSTAPDADAAPADPNAPSCNLCGKQGTLTKTPCCDNWICDDADQYVMFSFARNSCFRNHMSFTLCSMHFGEDHNGPWQTCTECRDTFETEMYVFYGTNDYNFESLENPPSFEPTHCAQCGNVIRLGYDSSLHTGDGKIVCETCSPPPVFG